MFILYYNLIALACFDSRDDIDYYMQDQALEERYCMVDYVDADEDLWYSINSRG